MKDQIHIRLNLQGDSVIVTRNPNGDIKITTFITLPDGAVELDYVLFSMTADGTITIPGCVPHQIIIGTNIGEL